MFIMVNNQTSNEPILQVRDLHTHFITHKATVRAVNGVSFDLQRGERLAIVGESGSGKSAMAMSLIQLIAYPGKIVSGSVNLEGNELIGMKESELNQIRGKSIGTIFQDPMSSLDPVMRISDQMITPIRKHLGMGQKEARNLAIDWLDRVGIPEAHVRIDAYPFEMSGGMRQRIMIAMALSCNPKVILADEPTTALDVTIQAQIVELLKNLTETTGAAMMFITHDLGLVARFAQKVAVMYAGKIVEYGTVQELFTHPKHPYTQSLLMTIPKVSGEKSKSGRLLHIEGFPHDMGNMIVGCSFKERCPAAFSRCYEESPQLSEREGTQLSACFLTNGLNMDDVEQEDLRNNHARMKQDVLTSTQDVVTAPDTQKQGNVLQIQDLHKHFKKQSIVPWRPAAEIKAVNGINISLQYGETIGIVGESGCGKSTTARLLLGLDEPTSGTIHVEGNVQIVFQDPYSSFNPKMKIGDIIAEPLVVKGVGTTDSRKSKVRELIGKVGLEASYLDRYPSQLSGGQRQRQH